MTHYGVQKLVAINSGGFVYAELDLSKPVHLVAPNNRGKTTLVNALQFLYIDDVAKMVFGRRSTEDSKRHYFGHDPSYLIFECATPSGSQCLLVRGLGHLRNFAFERYVYEREYQRQDFEGEHRRVAGFDIVRGRLANRRLLEVPSKQNYWEVLSGQLSTEGKEVPRLSILPLKKTEEYKAFREVFVSLLKLSDMDGRSLQELIIACHAREITERQIDIAADYKAEFERAERAEQDTAFIRAVRNDIDRGGKVRLDAATLMTQIGRDSPEVIRSARECANDLALIGAQLTTAIVKRGQEQSGKKAEQSRLDIEVGVRDERLRVARDALEQLDKAHTKWSAYTPLSLQSLRNKIEELEDRIAELRQTLQRNLDPALLKTQVERLERQLAQERAALEHWDKTAFSALRGLGITEPRLLWLFRVLNPGLLNLIVDQTLTIKNPKGLLAKLELLRERIERNVYKDEAVEINLEPVPGPDLVSIKNKEHLRDQIKLTASSLEQARNQLKIAEDGAAAEKELAVKTADHRACRDELTAYEQHIIAWQKRAELEAKVHQADEQVVVANKNAANARRELENLALEIENLRGQQTVLGTTKTQLQGSLRYNGELLAGVGLEFPAVVQESDPESERPIGEVKELFARAGELGKQLSALGELCRKVSPLREQLASIEKTIRNKSGEFGSQQLYFNDSDEEWRLLLERRDSLESLEEVSKRMWDALFTTLGARLNGIRLGMRSIENAINRINIGLKRYSVSNLKEVQLRVEKSADTYPMIEALTSLDSIFQNRDQIDEAKKRLRIMIESAQPIELQSLFALHIRVHQNDGRWLEAKSLDEIGSTGTGMTAKAMIFIQLVRAIVGNERYRLHFYMDETGHLDDQNLHATTSMAMSKGILPITAEPDVRIEPVAHPEVTVYALGQDGHGRFFIEAYNTYRAARTTEKGTTEVGHG